MKLKSLLTPITFIITLQAYAQIGRKVSGLVKDSTGTTIPGSTVELLTGKDNMEVATDLNGKFTFPWVNVNQLVWWYFRWVINL